MNLSNRSAWSLTALAVVALTLISHGWSVDAGLYLDDHSHYAQMRECGWWYGDIVEASRLGIIGRVMYLWFKDEAGLRFYRPVSFSLMKAEYTLVGWRPAGAHVFSLLWHVAAAMLVCVLAYRCIGRRAWAAVAGCVFAAHPAHVLTVYWIACQTELMVVTFVLAAVLCYSRYSNWPAPMFADRSQIAMGPAVPGGHIVWLLASCAFFALALGCRENAVVFPPLAVAGDLLLRPRQWRRRIFAYVILLTIVGVYLYLRHAALGGFPMPSRPYMVPLSDREFVSFVINKTIYYVLGLFALFPVLPIGGMAYLREHVIWFYAAFVVVVAVWGWFLWLTRRRWGLMLAPLWVLLSMLPVMPVFASGHHLYLPSVGLGLMVAAFWAWLVGGELGGSPIRRAAVRKAVGWTALVLHVIVFCGACLAFGWTFRASTDLEDLLVRDVVEVGPELHDGDKLFFINMSMMDYYAIPAIEQQTSVRNLRGHVLTFSPKLLMMDEPCAIEQIDDHSFSVSLERYGYFRGAMGRVLCEAMKRESFFQTGDRFECDEFEVVIADASDGGVRKLIFRFRRPLNDPGYHFYLGSRYRPAYPLTWRGPTTLRTASQP